MYEADDMPNEARDLAALLASKIYYYLGEYDEALSFALGAANAFEAEARAHTAEEYVETVVCTSSIRPYLPTSPYSSFSPAKAIDRYIHLRSDETSGSNPDKIDPRLHSIIQGIFSRCIEDREYKQVCPHSSPSLASARPHLSNRQSVLL
jgi:26S proteasome regulatory subunit N2